MYMSQGYSFSIFKSVSAFLMGGLLLYIRLIFQSKNSDPTFIPE